MRSIPILLLFLGAAGVAGAVPVPNSPESARASPTGELLALERLLIERQAARDAGMLPVESYQRFIIEFRASLSALTERIADASESRAVHARILSRMGEPETELALADLSHGLSQNPEDPALLRALGEIHYQRGNFPAAAGAARRAWESSGRQDKTALALLKMSEGRVSSLAEASGRVSESGAGTKSLHATGERASAEWATRRQTNLAFRPVPAAGLSETPAQADKFPMLPLLAAGGAGLTALGIYRVATSRSTATGEGVNPVPEVSPEQARANVRNSVVLLAAPLIVVALVYGGPAAWRALAPAAAVGLRAGQQSAQRLASSEVGSIMPRGKPAQEAIALTGYTRHGLHQAISRDGAGVSPAAIMDALKSPLEIIKQDGGKTKFVGRNATVILNKAGEVVTTWANNQAAVRTPRTGPP